MNDPRRRRPINRRKDADGKAFTGFIQRDPLKTASPAQPGEIDGWSEAAMADHAESNGGIDSAGFVPSTRNRRRQKVSVGGQCRSQTGFRVCWHAGFSRWTIKDRDDTTASRAQRSARRGHDHSIRNHDDGLSSSIKSVRTRPPKDVHEPMRFRQFVLEHPTRSVDGFIFVPRSGRIEAWCTHFDPLADGDRSAEPQPGGVLRRIKLAKMLRRISFHAEHHHPAPIENGSDVGTRSADQDQAASDGDGLAESVARVGVGNRNLADECPLVPDLPVRPSTAAFFIHSRGADHQQVTIDGEHGAEFVTRSGGR